MDPVWQLTEETLRRHCRISAPLAPDTRFREDLGLDSLGLLTLAIAAEDHFRIHLQEDPEHPPATIGEFIRLVQLRLQQEGRCAL